MSETSETMGRCFSEVYERRGSPCELKIADAIDRLAADVAAVKESVCDGSVAEERDRFLAGMGSAIKERDAAIRERDTAMAAVERLRAELAARPAANPSEIPNSSSAVTEPAQDASEEIAELKFWVEKYRVKAEAYGGMVRGCAPALERAGHPVNGRGPDGAVGGIARAVEALIRERDTAMAAVERLRAELAARPAANSPGISDSSPVAPPPAAPAAGWLREEERGALSRAFDLLCDDDGDNPLARTIQTLLARAGSPPVVEVPATCPSAYGFDSPFSNGQYRAGYREACLVHRAAIRAVGGQWKEVGRE